MSNESSVVLVDNVLTLVWFRKDLRLSDNPALAKAANRGDILPVFILDDVSQAMVTGASAWWLEQSLKSLDDSLGGALNVFCGDPLVIINKLCDCNNISHVVWNRCYEASEVTRDKYIKSALREGGKTVETFNGRLLYEPWQVLKKDDTPYKVFTPFYRRGYQGVFDQFPEPLPIPKRLVCVHKDSDSIFIDELGLTPKKTPWFEKLESQWSVSEKSAHRSLASFIDHKICNYETDRDFPSQDTGSHLGPYLHWGQISPLQVVSQVRRQVPFPRSESFLRQLVWREFSHYLLFYFPRIAHRNLKSEYDCFPWGDNPTDLTRWQQGQTGIPLVDAGMRQLWQTGTMHNRVRMICASFLVKNLLIHWKHGADWFMDCLLDADVANNSAGWQWVAGSGADAAPFFRIFNPVTQGEKFDAHGEYIRKYIPELSALPEKYICSPWLAPASELAVAGVELGVTYPKPMVDLKSSRQDALDALKHMKQENARTQQAE